MQLYPYVKVLFVKRTICIVSLAAVFIYIACLCISSPSNPLDGDRTYMVRKVHRPHFHETGLSGFTSLMNLSAYKFDTLDVRASTKKNKTLTIMFYNKPKWEQTPVLGSTCKYNQCTFSDDRGFINTADAVVFCPSYAGFGLYPPIKSSGQVWVMFSQEAPVYYYYHDFKSPAWNNMINWTMTYSLDSDILAPYGTVKPREHIPQRDYEDIWDRKKHTAVMLSSHCKTSSLREVFSRKLRQYGVDLTVLGKCGNVVDDGDYTSESNTFVKHLNEFKFFFAFENSFCKDYVTEKLFKRYDLDLILVTRGGADYDRLFPDVPLIDATSFSHVAELAKFLNELSADKTKYIDFLKRKDKYEAQTPPFSPWCELCRKLQFKERYKKLVNSIGDLMTGACFYAPDV